MTFAESAMRYWNVAAQALGWRPREFWSATPAELVASLPSSETGFEPVATELLADLQRRFPD